MKFYIAFLALLLQIGCGELSTNERSGAKSTSPSPDTQTRTRGNWISHESKSAMGDSSTVFSSIDSNNKLLNSIGMGKKVTMLVDCTDNRTSVIFLWPVFLGTAEPVEVDFKIDDGAIFSHMLYTGGESFVFSGGGEAIPFLRKLNGSSRLVVRAAGWREGPQEAILMIEGIAEGTKAVQTACNWRMNGG